VKVQGPNLYPILGREKILWQKPHVNSWVKESNLWFKVTKFLHALKANCTQGQSWVAFLHVMQVEKHNCIVSSDWTCVFYVNFVMCGLFCFWRSRFLKDELSYMCHCNACY
jgi:hypothetical protein